jgi:nicotinamidase-related amidase
MQNLFAEDTPWHTPWMSRVLPIVHRIAERHKDRTIFTRFIPPVRPQDLPGAWRRYYEHWPDMTLENLDPALIQLVPALRELVPPAFVIDKHVYSAFSNPSLRRVLHRRHIDSLVITGAETDVCVLATIMHAVDLGYRIVLPTDALCSGSDATHDALLSLYRNRYSQQIETCTSDELLDYWIA